MFFDTVVNIVSNEVQDYAEYFVTNSYIEIEPPCINCQRGKGLKDHCEKFTALITI